MKTLALIAVLLLGCTGENVDESFLETHGALLARVECRGTAAGKDYDYRALMFLDGSVMVFGSDSTPRSDVEFFERSDADRVHGSYRSLTDGSCGGAERYVSIVSGVLTLHNCQGSPPAYSTTSLFTLSTECTGFNQSLFD